MFYRKENGMEENSKAASPVLERKGIWVGAVADGELYTMEEIPDPVFSTGVLGKCVGILPSEGTVYSPCDGILASVAETGHALTFNADNGEQFLVHVGIDTVEMNGKGFRVLKEAGSRIKLGDPVLEADLDMIREAGHSTMIIIVRLNK